MKTKTVGGYKLSLESGKRYLATRPFAQRGVSRYPVSITEAGKADPAVTLPALGYDAANEFLAKFNNGKVSFSGRVW